MNIIDWILILPLGYAAWAGFRDGVAAQLGGLVGLLLGVYLAFRFATTVGSWFGVEGFLATAVGFLCTLVVVIFVIFLLGTLLKGLFRMTGLGVVDEIGGLVLGVAKMALLLSVLLTGFDAVNRTEQFVAQWRLDNSLLYRPIRNVSSYVFPYLDIFKAEPSGTRSAANPPAHE